jgi:hypothetical protein
MIAFNIFRKLYDRGAFARDNDSELILRLKKPMKIVGNLAIAFYKKD